MSVTTPAQTKAIAERLGYKNISLYDDGRVMYKHHYHRDFQEDKEISLTAPAIQIEMIGYLLTHKWDIEYDGFRKIYECSKENKRKMCIEFCIDEPLTQCVIDAMVKECGL